jgi:protein TonB
MLPALNRSDSYQSPIPKRSSMRPVEPFRRDIWRYLGINDPFMRAGLTISTFAHLAVLVGLTVGSLLGSDRIPPQVIYSVTLEGGKSLGGLAQTAKKEKTQMAPPKKIQEPQKTTPAKAEEKKVAIKKPEPKPEPKKVEPKKEEVKLKPKEIQKKPEPKKAPPPKKVEPKKQPAAKESQADIDKRLQQAVQRYTGESTAAGGAGFGAGRLGGEGMGGGVQRPPEFFTYKGVLEDFLKAGWRWYDPNANLQALVSFEMKPTGELFNVKLVASSGVSQYDESVLRAVQKASPVPMPPENVYQFFKEVRITFVPGE